MQSRDKDCELKEAYGDSFLSENHPGVALSRNTVCTFLNDLGKAYSHVVEFMRNRISAVRADHHLLVGGTLKTDNSTVDSLSDLSRKARVKGVRDISVMYAFDLEAVEPVCSQCFPGNMLDITAYDGFLRQNNITRGLIASDKGIPASAAEKHFGSHADLHYLNPLRRNSQMIDFLSTLLTFRLINAFDKARLLEKHTYKKVTGILWHAKKVRSIPTDGDGS